MGRAHPGAVRVGREPHQELCGALSRDSYRIRHGIHGPAAQRGERGEIAVAPDLAGGGQYEGEGAVPSSHGEHTATGGTKSSQRGQKLVACRT
jgi:hypothetical protein